MVRIRLRRIGKKKQPSYRVVVADSEAPRDGRFIERIGFYNPRTDPPTIEIKEDRALYWLSQGAQPSDPVARLLRKQGILQRFEASKRGAALEESAAPVEAVLEDEPSDVEAPPVEAALEDEPSDVEAPPVEAALEDEPSDVEAVPVEAALEDEPSDVEAPPVEAALEDEPSDVEAAETEVEPAEEPESEPAAQSEG